jgi:hypothetical protein
MNEILESFVNKKIYKIFDVAIIEKSSSINPVRDLVDIIWFKYKYEPVLAHRATSGVSFKGIVCYNKEKNFFETESSRFLIQAPTGVLRVSIDWKKFEKLYEENRVKENL